MDPDKCLEELLELNRNVVDFVDSYGDELETVDQNDMAQFMGNISDLCDHIAGLNGWLEKGGFLPEVWRKL